jgi:hypothetical protein
VIRLTSLSLQNDDFSQYLSLREEHRLRVFENRVLRGIFVAEEGRANRRVEKIT